MTQRDEFDRNNERKQARKKERGMMLAGHLEMRQLLRAHARGAVQHEKCERKARRWWKGSEEKAGWLAGWLALVGEVSAISLVQLLRNLAVPLLLRAPTGSL